ncbi:MAG: hypothetical protein HWE08_01620 [Alphaproteobacteria bacterium]|nr:hypothetical protein [Alphaproteobacteria bacterium]
MDIQGTANTNVAAVAGQGRSGALESAATERKSAEDSAIERKEVEASDTGAGVGEKVDIQA